ncbi:MAG TPA: toxin-antitoxin system YwqK family antitoxin [Paludibacteraceae bacterium]|mgnify:FL=1|nr:toxin-antitoxin system YwqK family antitoxin [Paludibacteraceae bacterium]
MRQLSAIIICFLFCSISIVAQKNDSTIVQSEGLFYTDATQTKLYTGEYKEFYDNHALRLEMFIKDGKPEGMCIIYFPNGKPKEVRSYLNGVFHGTWRTYNDTGVLISEAEYLNNKKHGTWRIWDDQGTLRYEMHYVNGEKTGTWYMWDENGKLISERKY